MRNFIWTSADPANRKTRYRELKERGITGVFLSGLDEAEVEAIRAAGLEAHIWMWTTNRGDQWIRDNHPEWYMVSRTGKSCFDHPPYVDYYRWISPAIPAVQDYLAEKVDEIARHSAVNGVHLDYVRYPDIILPNALWKQYNVDQREEMPEYDFCYSEATCREFEARFGRDPRKIENPASDQEWLHFRYDTVTRLVERLATAARSYRKEVSAAVFPTPRMARKICRQDWDKWPLDLVAPMIYNSFYDEPVDWIGDCVLEDVQAVKFPVVAGLYMPALEKPGDFRRALQLVSKRGGCGASLFGGVSKENWAEFERWTGHK